MKTICQEEWTKADQKLTKPKCYRTLITFFYCRCRIFICQQQLCNKVLIWIIPGSLYLSPYEQSFTKSHDILCKFEVDVCNGDSITEGKVFKYLFYFTLWFCFLCPSISQCAWLCETAVIDGTVCSAERTEKLVLCLHFYFTVSPVWCTRGGWQKTNLKLALGLVCCPRGNKSTQVTLIRV